MMKILCILLLDIVVMIFWELFDPLQSEVKEISAKVGEYRHIDLQVKLL